MVRNPWRDLTDPRRARDLDDLEEGLKDPAFENLEIPEYLGAATLVVDDHKVKRYAFTVDDYHPWSFGVSPFGRRIGQAGLVTNDIVQLFTQRYAASKTVGLHTEEQLWFERPIPLDSQVTIEGTYVESYTKRGLGYVVMEAAVTNPDGETMIRHRGVEVLRTVPGEVVGRGNAESQSGERRIFVDYDTALPFVLKAGPGLRLGSPLAPLRTTITQEQASVFSRSGEYVRNAHNDLAIARHGGLRIPIVQGQQQLCVVLTLMTHVFGAHWYTSGWIRVKFINPLEVFTPATVGGVVRTVDSEVDGEWVNIDVWVQRSDGVLTTVGTARCLVDSAQVACTTVAP
jgi:acyl dehydratase